MHETHDQKSELQVLRNSFWVLGLKDDFYTIQQIKQTVCNEDEVPIIVVLMHPSSGLVLDELAGHYMSNERLGEHFRSQAVKKKKALLVVHLSLFGKNF